MFNEYLPKLGSVVGQLYTPSGAMTDGRPTTQVKLAAGLGELAGAGPPFPHVPNARHLGERGHGSVGRETSIFSFVC